MYHTCRIIILLLAVITVALISAATDTDTGADRMNKDDSNHKRHTRETEPEVQGGQANHYGSCVCNCNCPQQVDHGNHTSSDCGHQNEDTVKPFLPRDCEDLMLIGGNHEDGVYTVYLGDQNMPYEVYCDMTTDAGGWLVFQKRFNGDTNFTSTYYEYAIGFGSISGEFWLGNRVLRLLTQQKQYNLKVEMTDFSNVGAYAKYSTFGVGPSSDNFRLTVGGYSGTAGDSMAYHNGQMFSAEDADNDKHASYNCAQTYKGGWWYNSCHHANPNGLYHNSVQASCDGCIRWHHFRGPTSLKTMEMKLRPQP